MPVVNWEAAGAIGEILGAAAVIVTLLYLARQVADTKKALRQQASNDVNSMFNEVHHVIASSPFLAEAMEKLENGEEISGAERYQVRSMFLAQMNAFENLYHHSEESGDFLAMGEARTMTKVFLSEPWVGNLWEENKIFLGDNFLRFVDGVESI